MQTSATDLDYYEVLVEYVAAMQDSHARYLPPTTFVAQLGFSVDIFDGKILVDSINRNLLPMARYPFAIGDELVSVDGIAAETALDDMLKFNSAAHAVPRRRSTAAWLTIRPQNALPKAVLLGDEAKAVIRSADGGTAEYTIAWLKTGLPIRTVGPVPDPRVTVQTQASLPTEWPGSPSYMRPLLNLWNVSVDHETVLRSGSRIPVFDARPAGFVQRRGQLANHNFFSGTFMADGVRLGYIRIPSMAPLPVSNDPFTTALIEFATEIAFMQQNTDGLIVDVMRNPGGQVTYVDALCSLLSPVPFRTLGFEVRATQNWLLQFDIALQSARAQNAPEWVINLLTSLSDALRKANAEQRGMTGPLPLASLSLDLDPAPGAYTKPIVVLADEFSASGGDMLPAILQDNRRAIIVGGRTNGAGGNVVSVPVGAYTEGVARVTQSLMNRKNPVAAPGLKAANYVENIGVLPDVPVEYMTRENLMTGGQPYLSAITRIAVEHVRGSR